MSLGFEQAGFKPIAAVEISPMAAETHFRNFHLRGRPWDEEKWRELRALGEAGHLDEQIERGTVVASILSLLNNESAMQVLSSAKPDVIIGGPPCQGFSMAGRRDPKDKRNLLPWAFLEFVRKLRPKAVVIENVIGINRAFSSTSGAVSAFERLRTELENQGDGYVVQPVEVNARHFGVPQNRPRMMLIALRGDQFSGPPEAKRELWRSIDAWEASKPPNSPPLTTNEMAPTIGSQIPDDPRFKEYTAGEALIDLDETINVDEYHSGYKLDPTPEAYGSEEYRYAALMRGLTPPGARTPVARLENHETRNHTPRVVQRFHLYHFMAKHHIERSVLALARTEGSDEAVAMRVRECLGDAANLDIQGYDFAEGSDRVLFDVVMRLRTKKHTQKVVPADRPAPTVVTLPDDYIHPFQARVMTVRELARIQSFPDWFEFRARVTTGGSRRRLDVPQYSQVGNAVPPLLAQAIGKVVMRLLQRP